MGIRRINKMKLGSVILCLISCLIGFVLNIGSIIDNKPITIPIVGFLIEIPCIIWCVVDLNKFGRKLEGKVDSSQFVSTLNRLVSRFNKR